MMPANDRRVPPDAAAPGVHERWRAHFDDDIAFHRKTAAIYDHVNTEPRLLANDLLFAPLERHVARGDTLVDLGCGTGRMLLRFASRFARAIGVDHSREMLAIAQDRLRAAHMQNCTLVESDFFDFLERRHERYSMVSCVGCLHHLPVDAFESFFAQVRARLARGGALLLAEPVDTGGRSPPLAIQRWNARSLMAARAPLMPMEESAEAPIDAAVLLERPGAFGFHRVAASRGWEIFQRAVPASLIDHLRIRYLHRRFGTTGNVIAALWRI
jgi:SAM-dependent methyltransferase